MRMTSDISDTILINIVGTLTYTGVYIMELDGLFKYRYIVCITRMYCNALFRLTIYS